MRAPDRSRGFSLLEILIASFVSLLALAGILYLYKAQHKTMVVQSGTSDMRMNGQYTLNELQYYLAHAGLGLPPSLRTLYMSGEDLVVRSNPTKRSATATLDASSTTSRTVYRIARSDMDLFAEVAFAAAIGGARAVEAPISDVRPDPGHPSRALVTLLRSRVDFPAGTQLYPVQKLRLSLCRAAPDGCAEGEFKLIAENPGARRDLRFDSLALAEGIEAISYRWLMLNRDTLDVLPASLDSLQKIEIKVVARNQIKDRALEGDGHRRQTLTARVSYRRTL